MPDSYDDFDWSQVPDQLENETARYSGNDDFDWSAVPDQLDNETARDDLYNRYLEAAISSGVDSSLVQTLKDAWKTGSKALDSVGAFAKNNPGLTSMITSGIGNAQKQKYDAEQMEKKNQFNIDAENRAKAYAKELYDRRNQSVIDTRQVDLRNPGNRSFDDHLAYLNGRK